MCTQLTNLHRRVKGEQEEEEEESERCNCTQQDTLKGDNWSLTLIPQTHHSQHLCYMFLSEDFKVTRNVFDVPRRHTLGIFRTKKWQDTSLHVTRGTPIVTCTNAQLVFDLASSCGASPEPLGAFFSSFSEVIPKMSSGGSNRLFR